MTFESEEQFLAALDAGEFDCPDGMKLVRRPAEPRLRQHENPYDPAEFEFSGDDDQ